MIDKWCDSFNKKFHEFATALTDFVTPEWVKDIARSMDRFDEWIGKKVYEPLGIDLYKSSSGLLSKPEEYKGGSWQVGGHVPRDGLYRMHAGETVTMKGSTPSGGGSSNITVDFSGANINLSGGIDLDRFSEAISMKIAEKQQSITY